MSLLVLMAPLAGLAATPDEEARFVAAVRKAFADRAVAGLEPLICRDQTPESVRQSSTKMYDDLVKETSVDWDIVLRDADVARVGKDTVENGVTYRPNLQVTKQLELRARDKEKKTLFVLTCAVGEKDGKLLIASHNPVK